MYESLIKFIRETYDTAECIPLHSPIFSGREREYVDQTLSSTFVSSIGAYVNTFEDQLRSYTKAPSVVVTVNGTSSLHLALLEVGVAENDLVITQPLTFVATCNAIRYCGGFPVFVDVDRNTLGMSPDALECWLNDNANIDLDGVCRHKLTNQIIRACLPMHTFGHPVDIENIQRVCRTWRLKLVEDAAEALGSLHRGRHLGTFGNCGILSFNGNKIITTGGGGAVLSDLEMGARVRHMSTTARKHDRREHYHDFVGYNYRMPNINAALGCAQLEQIETFVSSKRSLALNYEAFFRDSQLEFIREPDGARSNYWLNAVICESSDQRDLLIAEGVKNNVMLRPVWRLMHRLPMYVNCQRGELTTSEWLGERLVNLPSSVAPHAAH